MNISRALVVVAALAACKGKDNGKPAATGSAEVAPMPAPANVAMVDHAQAKIDGPSVTPVITGSVTFVVPKDATWWGEMAFPCYAAAINLQPGQSVATPFTQLSPTVEPAIAAAGIDLEHDIAAVGAWGTADWEAIDNLITRDGTGSGTILYRNFQALLDATGADAINDDDESHYEVDSTVTFARMVNAMGYRAFTIAPYTAQSHWQGVTGELGDLVDRVYLQVYSGGAGNDPASWSQALGRPVDPGLWSNHGSGCAEGDSPAQVGSRMRSWRDTAAIPGGFMWLYDDMKKCASKGSAAAYAKAIKQGVA